MSLHLYNTLTRKLEEFAPMDGKTVRMYVCGPTVYDDPHLGHARSAYIFDVLRRYLEYRGYPVTFVRNVTDVDDKIIGKAKEELGARGEGRGVGDLKTTCREVAERYLKSYHDTLDRLGIRPPTQEPAATAHIDDMLNMISQLVLNGSAYETKTGDVYFAVRKFPGYGRLSNRSVDELQSSARGEHPVHGEAGGGAGKQDPLDFALWKAAKPGEPSWPSPWGQGRPGWHIECSAMSTKYLGNEFDIHGGGVDLVFPHHENEIAQAQAIGKKFARFWIHNGLLTVNGEKMSKSLGNFITVDQALKKCRDEVSILKVFFLSAHYRSPIDYAKSNIEAAVARYDGLSGFLSNADFFGQHQFVVEDMPPDVTPKEVVKLKSDFERAMGDDLNTPRALAVLDDLAGLGYQWIEEFKRAGSEGETDEDYISANIFVRRSMASAAAIQELGALLGLTFIVEVELTQVQHLKLKEREQARERKDFKRADEIRKEFAEQQLVIDDTENGPVVRRKR